MERVTDGEQCEKWNSIQYDSANTEMMRDGINEESNESNYCKGNQNIEYCFSQTKVDNKSFHLRAVIARVVFNIKHDTKHCDEHKIFYEKQTSDFIGEKWNIVRDIII